jgi:hypothetical protein
VELVRTGRVSMVRGLTAPPPRNGAVRNIPPAETKGDVSYSV